MIQTVPFSALPLSSEVKWIAARIANEAEKLTSFVSCKERFEELYLLGDLAVASDLLDELESELGVSLFLLEMRTALFQQSEGLERQKNFSSFVRDQAPSRLLELLAFYVSQRNEPARNSVLFQAAIGSMANELSAPQEFKDYVRFRLLRVMPYGKDALAGVLRIEANSSLIDQYETLLVVLTEALDITSECAETVASLRTIIRDPRLDRLAFLYGLAGTEVLKVSKTSVQAQSYLDEDHPQQAIDTIASANESTLQSYLIRGLALADLQEELDAPSSSTSAQIGRLVHQVAMKKAGYEEGTYELLRIVLCQGALTVADIVRPILHELAASTTPMFLSEIRRSFISAPFVSVEAIPIVPPFRRNEYMGLLRDAGYPISYSAGSNDEWPTATSPLRWKLLFSANENVPGTESEITRTLRPRLKRQLIRRRVQSLLDQGDLSQAIEVMVNAYFEDPSILLMLPIPTSVEQIDEFDPRSAGTPLMIAVIYDLYLRHIGDERPEIRSDAYEDLIEDLGVKRPTEIDISNIQASERKALLYFLRFICVPEVMATSEFFDGSRALETERLELCKQLRIADPSNSAVYEEELKEVTRRQIISEGLRDVEQGKFALDVQRLRRWADKHIKEAFNRFQALRTAGVRATTTNLVPNEDGIDLPESPMDEAGDLLNDMVGRFLYESYTNSFYGLDSYLSLRARHGALSGQLRAPLEEEQVITKREGLTQEYKRNVYWLSRMGDNPSANEEIAKALQEFSSSFDRLVKEFADKELQIRSKEKPDGLFSYSIDDLSLYVIVSDLRTDTSLQAFVDRCLDLFWRNVEESLLLVRLTIDQDLREKIITIISGLTEKLERLRDIEPDVELLISAVLRSQTRLHHALTNLQEWFHAPKAEGGRIFTAEDIVEITLEQVRRLHPQFQPQTTKNIDPALPPFGDYRRISDIFFILFDNIQKHASNEHQPQVDITVQYDNAGRLIVDVENDGSFLSETEQKLANIRETIAKGQYQHIVSSEGGSGLVKLWNLVRPEERLQESPRLEFGPRGDRFRVQLSIPFTILESANG